MTRGATNGETSVEGAHLDVADLKARDTEAEMTDDERFSLLVSVMGTNTWIREHDPRIPTGCR